MLSQTLVVALAGAASADMVLPRRVQDLAALGLTVQARDSDSGYTFTATNEAESTCFSAMAVWTDAPGTPFNINDYVACGALPSSLTAAASSYQKVAVSWWDAHSSRISAAYSLCRGVGSISEITSRPTCTYTGTDLATPPPTTAPSAGQTIGSSSTTSSSRPSPTDTSSTTSSSGPPPTGTSNSTSAPTGTAADANTGKNTGHRETGLAWAAVAIAGLLGAVALL